MMIDLASDEQRRRIFDLALRNNCLKKLGAYMKAHYNTTATKELNQSQAKELIALLEKGGV